MKRDLMLRIGCCWWLVVFFALLPASSVAQSAFQTLGPKGCGLGKNSCHTQENPWWSGDAHSSSAKVFKSPTERYQTVAQKYGISLGNAAQVNKECMDCHGTVISGKATLAAEGVSCESCHGPGSGYNEPHREEGRAYAIGITFGMTKNQDLKVRAAMCVQCHYISDAKLLAADHPKGSVAYDYYIDGMKRIAKHWVRRFKIEPDADLQKAFDAALKARGATPVAKGSKKTTRPGGGLTETKTPAPVTPGKTTPAPPPPVVKPAAQVQVYQDVIEPPAKYQTLGPKGTSGCGLGQTNCHAKENDWWVEDEKNQKHKHYYTHRKFLEPAGLYAKYIKAYGIDGDQAKINQICMKCHGTVITAKADKEVTVGVSCESCHGPGSGYRDPHVEEGKSYTIGITLGMIENKNLDVRAKNCARCHYIAEQKLIALTGHSSGDDFEYFEGIQQLTPHWKPNRAAENEDNLKATYALAMQAKGPAVLIVQEVNKPQPEVTPPDNDPPLAEETRSRRRDNPPVRKELKFNDPPPINLQRFDSVVDTTSLRNLIITLKRRLEELSRAGTGDQP